MTEEGKQKLTEHLERCLPLELADEGLCLEVRADRLAEQWAKAGRIDRVFKASLAHEHSKWVLKHDKGLKECYLSAKRARTEVQAA